VKWFAYLLILLMISAQVGDVWAVDPDMPSAPVADDNDEYLPAKRQRREEESASDQGPMFVGLKSPTADFPLVRRGVPFDRNLTTPFTPPPLYVLMSLQI
jgi:hypothetical protein